MKIPTSRGFGYPYTAQGPRLYSDEWYSTVKEMLALVESEALSYTRGTTISQPHYQPFDFWYRKRKHPARSTSDWLRATKEWESKSSQEQQALLGKGPRP